MTRVFVDTSAFVALRNRAEQEHEAARAALSRLVDEKALLFTSNHVFAETYTALLVRVSRAEAIEWSRRFRTGWTIELIRVDEPLEEDAWTLLESHTDKQWSYVDATSFALMERENVQTAFAFDHHFTQRGLTALP